MRHELLSGIAPGPGDLSQTPQAGTSEPRSGPAWCPRPCRPRPCRRHRASPRCDSGRRFGRPWWTSFLSGRELVAELVKEIEDEVDLVHRGASFCVLGLQHGKALAIGVQVKIKFGPLAGERPGGPELWLIGMEGVGGSGVGSYHDLAAHLRASIWTKS